jgi:hypothetical protein
MDNKTMNKNLLEFWQTSWTVWRSGELSFISQAYAKIAALDFNQFMRKSKDAKNSILKEFLTAHPPQEGEFLIGYFGEEPGFVLTNKRIWMYNNITQDHISFYIKDIAEFQSKGNLTSFYVKVRQKDNVEFVYKKISGVPDETVMKIVLQRYQNSLESIKQNGNQLVETLNNQHEELLTNEMRLKQFKNQIIISLREKIDWFILIEANNEESVVYRKEELKTKLRQDIQAGKFNKDQHITIHQKVIGGKWNMKETTLIEFSKGHFNLRIIYQPVWAHAVAGIRWGVLGGIFLKLIDTFFFLLTRDLLTAILFLATIAVIFIPKIRWIGFIAMTFILAKFGSTGLFLTVLTSAVLGAFLGSLPGMAVGGIVGLIRKNSILLAKDASSEPSGLIFKAVIAPIILGCTLLIIYFLIFNPWLIQVLDKLK